jgi:hypothetical protein
MKVAANVLRFAAALQQTALPCDLLDGADGGRLAEGAEVSLGDSERFVAQSLLNLEDADAAAEEMSGESMPKGVRSNPPVDPAGLSSKPSDQFAHSVAANGRAGHRAEQRPAGRQSPSLASCGPHGDCCGGRRVQADDPAAVPLRANDPQRVIIYVGGAKSDQLGDADASALKGTQQSTIAKAQVSFSRRGEQQLYFVGRHRHRRPLRSGRLSTILDHRRYSQVPSGILSTVPASLGAASEASNISPR